LFRDPHTEQSAVARLWSAGGGESSEGGHTDFTSPNGFKWWFGGVLELRKSGIDAIWNENNKIYIPDDDWQCALVSEPISQGLFDNRIGLWGRALHTELMSKSSHDALKSVEPAVRPFVLTRSATAGTTQYTASNWSGDNVASSEGMKGATAISLNAGMSLLHVLFTFDFPQ
jgi:alpha-glucosidase (family GH31 glycosyl hydrolase)